MTVIARCQTCNANMLAENIKGKYIVCPNCRNEYILGWAKRKLERYLCINKCEEAQFIKAVFCPKIDRLSVDFFAKVEVICQTKVCIPYVEVVFNGKEYMVAIPQNTLYNGCSYNDIPKIIDFARLVAFHRQEGNTIKHILPNDTSYNLGDYNLDIAKYYIKNNRGATSTTTTFIGKSVYYVPMWIIKLKYYGKIYGYYCYGDVVGPIDGSNDIPLEDIQEHNYDSTVLPRWLTITKRIVTLALIVQAWLTFCYTYQTLNGYWALVIWNSGYKCFFNFLGALGVILVCMHFYFHSINVLRVILAEGIANMKRNWRAASLRRDAKNLHGFDLTK